MNAARLPHRHADGLTPAQRRSAVGAIVALHAAAAWGLMQVEAVREVVADAAPIFVAMERAEAAPAAIEPQATTPPPKPSVSRRIVTAAPTPTPQAIEPLPAPEREPQQQPPVSAPAQATPAPASSIAAAVDAPVLPAPPSPPPEPRQIPPSAVQYLEAPVLQVPAASARAGESGRAVVRVLIDEHGLPRTVQLARSSGFKRLDDAALAAVRRARFRPYAENGQPQPGWALIPLTFELEK